MKLSIEQRRQTRIDNAHKEAAQKETGKIKPAFLKRSGFRVSKWKDRGATYEDYVIENKHVKIEIYGEAPEVDINANGDGITVPNCKTEDDLKALLKLFGFPGNNNKTV